LSAALEAALSWTLERLSDSVREYEGGGPMSFKFLVGQAVEYTPVGEKTAGLYKIVRQMPEEEQAFDLKYLIKSEAEAYERNVLECQLSSNVRADSDYTMTKPRRSQGSHKDRHEHPHPCPLQWQLPPTEIPLEDNDSKRG
jgi:hypothetical protein